MFKNYLTRKHNFFYTQIKNTHDENCPHPVFDVQNKIIGYGCVICDKLPKYCPYFEKNEDCKCESCDIFTEYRPSTIYTTRKILEEHLITHDLYLDKNIILKFT